MQRLGNKKSMKTRIEGHGSWCAVCHPEPKTTKRSERANAIKRALKEADEDAAALPDKLEYHGPNCPLCR